MDHPRKHDRTLGITATFLLVFCLRRRSLWWTKPIIRICLAVLFPEFLNAPMVKENLHASIPRPPNMTINISDLVEEILLRAEIEKAEEAFPLVDS